MEFFGPSLSRRLLAAPLVGILGLGAIAPLAMAQDRPSEEALRDLEARGRRIAGYHEAVARARERFKPLPDPNQEVQHVVVDRNGSWKVIVMSRAGDASVAKGWQMLAEIGFNPKAGEVTTLERMLQPRQAPADAAIAQRAIELSRSMMVLHVPDAKPPYLEAVFREPDKSLVVYLQPYPEKPGSARLGGDLIAQISPDGQKLFKARAPHGSAAWVEVSPGPKGEPTVHSHPGDDLPAETDVALAIENPKLAPLLVLTPRYMFRVDQAGAITYLGLNTVPPAAPGGTR